MFYFLVLYENHLFRWLSASVCCKSKTQFYTSCGSQARERAYEELLQKASEYQKAEKLESMFMPPGPRLGNVVVEAQGLQKGFNGRLLINNLSFNLPPGGM